jgi:hypothetical protein
MKNLILVALLSLAIMFTSQVCLAQSDTIPQSQEQVNDQSDQIVKQGFFARIFNGAKQKATDGIMNIIFGIIAGIGMKHGWTLMLKKIANKGKLILKEGGELLSSGSNFLDALDNHIRDDGSLAENTLKEMIEAGKPVIAEGKDFIISVKPI